MISENSISIDAPSCWIIAYGNPQRGDDGIGPYVAEKLQEYFGLEHDVGICTLPQLDLTLLEEIQSAEHLIFVDASVAKIQNGLRWSRVKPELNGWAMDSHHIDPSVFLGLLQLLYDCNPTAWVVSVYGRNFNLGQELSPEARSSADKATMQIVDWLFHRSIALPHKKFEKEE